MPALPEDEFKDDESGFDIFNPEKYPEFQYDGDCTLYEDEDARTFYETLPDLKAFIPGVCCSCIITYSKNWFYWPYLVNVSVSHSPYKTSS